MFVSPITIYLTLGVYISIGWTSIVVDSVGLCPKIDFSLHSCRKTDYHAQVKITDGVFNETRMAFSLNDTAQSTTTNTWEIKECPGKGLGVFATILIEAGSRIMVEEPLFSIIPPEFVPGKGYKIDDMVANVDKEVAALSPEQQEDFHSCHEYRLPSEINSKNRNMFIFRSNAYTLADGTVAMFPKVAKINHSCRPNAANIWSQASRLRVIWAARDILPGEEVTVTYAPLLQSHENRQKRLEQYGFRCRCEACRDSEYTDPSRKKMAGLLDELQDRLAQKTSDLANRKLLSKAETLVEMLQEEHLADYLPEAYHLAAEVSLRLNNLTAAEEWTLKELRYHQCADENSTATRETLELLQKIR